MSNKLKYLMSIYAAMASFGNSFGYQEKKSYDDLTEEEKEKLKAIAEQRKIDRLKKNGLKEFFYGDKVIYARNKKNADRKARNKGYL